MFLKFKKIFFDIFIFSKFDSLKLATFLKWEPSAYVFFVNFPKL